jgi:flagellar motor switch protein FliG
MAKAKEKEAVEETAAAVEAKPKAPHEKMSGAERAAVIMLLLGEQQAADVIPFLSPKEVQSLGSAMVNVADLSQDTVNAVLDEFIGAIKQRTNLGVGTTDYVQNVFQRALGPDKASTILGRILPGSANKGLEILKWMDGKAIAEMIEAEHPQVIAVILSVLDHDVAAEVLSLLPSEQRVDVIQRVASHETVQPSAMEELEGIMQQQMKGGVKASSSNVDGIKTAANILNFVKVDLESQIMEDLSNRNEQMATQISDSMLTFDKLSGLDNRSVEALLRNIDQDMLMVALRGADDEVKDKFLNNMSQRAKAIFVDDMEAKGPMRLSDVEEAQRTIMRIARKLSDSGEIMLVGVGDDFV